MNFPLVSIIIPTYNRAHLIGETLDSILAQTYSNWECIVVDDGSMDNTDSLIGKYVEADSRICYYHRPHTLPKGASSCRNYGFELSKGEYINWFDSDDLMLENNLELKINYFKNSPECDFLYSGFSYFNNSEIFLDKLSVFKSENILEDLVSNKVKINTLSIIWKKNFLLGNDLFNEKIYKGEELEFYARMFSIGGIKYALLSESLCLVRLHDDSNRILNSYSDYNKVLIHSFYEARKIIHQIILREQCARATYINAVNFYLKTILFSISKKDFNTAYINLLFLKKNRFDNSINFRFQHYRLISILFLLRLTNLRGYDFLKKYLKIK